MDAIWIIFLFAIGACVGSFLNVVIYRVPRGESIVFPGSHCPSCGAAIRWYDNIPLISWLVLRARCRRCKAPIAARYIIVEASTALRVVGLYLCYYIFQLRQGTGHGSEGFIETWPMFLTHAMLLVGLLVCSVIDIEHWIVPLEICWLVSLVGIAAPAIYPYSFAYDAEHPLMPTVSPATSAMAIAALIGVGISLLLMRLGWLQQSFIDAPDNPVADQPSKKDSSDAARQKDGRKQKSQKNDSPSDKLVTAPQPSQSALKWILLPFRVIWGILSAIAFGYILSSKSQITAAAISKEHGVSPRKEILREVLFLLPAIVLGVGAYLLVSRVDAVAHAWQYVTDPSAAKGGRFAVHFNAFAAAVFGYIIGGAVVWGTRILGTLAFNKEAMGLGDAHLMAAVGAVAGWIVPTIAFFLAPFFGLLWAIYLRFAKGQRELPYGPWLAIATIVVMIFYDKLFDLFQMYLQFLSQV